MAVTEHLDILRLGTPEWNLWRKQNASIVPDLSSAHLQRVRLAGADLSHARCTLTYFGDADLAAANLNGADLSQAYLRNASLQHATLENATLVEVELSGADLSRARMAGADMRAARLRGVNLTDADLRRANLSRADLRGAIAVGTNLDDADLTACEVYGIAAWNVTLRGARQRDLLITPEGEHGHHDGQPGDRAVPLSAPPQREHPRCHRDGGSEGRSDPRPVHRGTEGGTRGNPDVLREHNLVPVLFDFEGPRNRDLTETISTLAHLSRAIVADLTDPRSVPHELMAVVTALPSVPVQPIIAESARVYDTFEHLTRYPWVAPVFRYPGPKELSAWLPGVLARLAPTR